MTLSTEFISTGRYILENFGQSLTFTRVVEGSFNPDTGSTSNGTTSTFSAYGSPMPYASSEIDGTNIRQQDRQLWLEVNQQNSIPKIGDTVSVSSVVYRVLNILEYIVEGVTVLYRLQIRI